MYKLFILFLFAISIVSAKHLASSTDWGDAKFNHPNPQLLSINNYSLRKSIGKIVGGNEVIPHSLPYQVIFMAINSETILICGGSLISANYILTCASCIYKAEFIEAKLGVHNMISPEEHVVYVQVKEFVVHEEWNPNTLANDIAVMKSSKQIQFNEYIQPVKLPKYSDVGNTYEGEVGTVSGWGQAKDGQPIWSTFLRFVEVPVMDNFNCSLSYLGFVTESNICTAGDGGKGFCAGDTGVPLVLDNVQIGVASFTNWDACEVGFPSVYTRVTSYLDWIEAKTDIVIEV